MVGVGPRFGNEINGRTGAPAVSPCIHGGLDLHLCDRFGWRKHPYTAIIRLEVRYSIERNIIIALPLSVHRRYHSNAIHARGGVSGVRVDDIRYSRKNINHGREVSA